MDKTDVLIVGDGVSQQKAAELMRGMGYEVVCIAPDECPDEIISAGDIIDDIGNEWALINNDPASEELEPLPPVFQPRTGPQISRGKGKSKKNWQY